MEDLLPYYERELGFLRRYSREFSERYPKIAGRLSMAGETSEDPHIERMIQSFALLNARTSKKLEDSYPEFTEALFEILYPHYLRPFPSCSIVKIDYLATSNFVSGEAVISRGTEMSTKSIKGVACTFRSAYDVAMLPLTVSSAQFDAVASIPDGIGAVIGATAKISITLNVISEQSKPLAATNSNLRFFIDGEQSFCAVLRDAVFMRCLQVFIESGDDGKWDLLGNDVIHEVGFEETEALLDIPARSHPAYRLLTEYFAFPEKFNFFDIEKTIFKKLSGSSLRQFKLHFLLGDIRSDSHIARVLSTLTGSNLLLGCAPVVNLFKRRGDPIRLTHTRTDYSVLPDSRRTFAYDIYSIDNVSLVRQTPEGESVTKFRPYYSLKHGQSREKQGHYWLARRDSELLERSPGYETTISIIDVDFNPAKIESDTLSIELTCTNRDLPLALGYGAAGGDLTIEGGSTVRKIQFLRKPSVPTRLPCGQGEHWRLISHLALSHLSLTKSGLDFIREIFSLYDAAGAGTSQKKIDSIRDVRCKPSTAWMTGNPFACLVRGMDVTLTIDESGFVGSSLHAFISMFNNFLGLYVQTNSFSRLLVVSDKNGQELRRCQPRSGNLNLL